MASQHFLPFPFYSDRELPIKKDMLQLAPNIDSIHTVFGAHYAVELKPQA